MMAGDRIAGTAVIGARIFDGDVWHDDGKALCVNAEGRIAGIVEATEVPADMPRTVLDGGMLVPGFIDLQVNGGGGILLNDRPDVEGIEIICRAHARFGTTALLPTLITDTEEVTARALEAGTAATGRVAGFLGLHMEGPHLSVEKKGAHDPRLIRPMRNDDFERLAAAAQSMPVLLTTLAPETVAPEGIGRLADAGVVVSLGHSNASCETARAAAEAGAAIVTHLFNAMSPLGHREPGMVGNALDCCKLYAGLIGDGVHVDPVAIGIALRAKRGPGRIFLVTDAMATIGTDLDSFTLNGRTVYRRGGRLELSDGTLAGADIDMISSVRFMHRTVGLPLEEALRMASLYPAQAIGQAADLGHLGTGARASAVHLSSGLEVLSVWIGGRRALADA